MIQSFLICLQRTAQTKTGAYSLSLCQNTLEYRSIPWSISPENGSGTLWGIQRIRCKSNGILFAISKTMDIGAMICYHTDLHQTRRTEKGPEEGRGFPPGGEISEGRGKEGGKGLGKGPGRGFEKEAPESHGIAPANLLYTTASYASILLWFAVLTAAVHGKGSFSRRNQADRQ